MWTSTRHKGKARGTYRLASRNPKVRRGHGNKKTRRLVLSSFCHLDIVLSISASEVKQIKGCTTSHEAWLKLEAVYQSKGPARKAILLRQLTTLKMDNDNNVHKYFRHFFDIVDKINKIGIEIDQDLFSTLLLISLPMEFDNFRCAIEMHCCP